MWEQIHPAIRTCTEPLVQSGMFDDAIFAAFRYVESEIQERLQSRSIGQVLVNEAFDGTPSKIDISPDNRTQSGIKSLFSGALEGIRGERGHGKVPTVPCTDPDTCLLYLAFATLLVHLLTQDKNILPKISSVRIFGTCDQPRAELTGSSFAADSRVLAGNTDLRITRSTPTSIEVVLSQGFAGHIMVLSANRPSNEVECDTNLLNSRQENIYEIVGVELPYLLNKSG